MLKKHLIKEKCFRKTKCAKIYIGVRIITITLLFSMALGGLPLFADKHDSHGGHKRNWELIIGGGGAVSPKYNGSDEIEVKPLPFIDARFRIDSLALFLNTHEDGAGMAVTLSESFPITLSAGVSFGESNRENSDVDLLKGTPDLENSYQLIGALHLPLPFVELISRVRYFPITADYVEAERPDKHYDGMRVDVDVENEVWLSRQIMLNLGAGLSWMNADYAKANYSVESQTDRLDVFEAKSGVHSIHASTVMIYMFTPRIGTALVGEGTYLLGDAADSPLTNSEFQPFGGIFVFYRF